MKICSCKGGCTCTHCDCSKYATVFDSLGNKSRLHVIGSLRKQPKSVQQIIDETGFEQTAVSHTLRKLEQSGIVSAKREGKQRIYSLNSKLVEPLLRTLDQQMRASS